jgi:thermitase
MVVRKRIQGDDQGALRLFLALTAALFLFSGAGTGQAQEPDPTQTPSLEGSQTPVSVEEAEITETATPVETEASATLFPSEEAKLNIATTRVLIKISPNARLSNVMLRMKEYGRVIENTALGKLGVFILEVPENQLEEKISELRNLPGVGLVEPDYPVQALDTFPNDPNFLSQYALTAIHAPQGWDISTGSSSVTIAILDSGVDLNHLDLVGKISQGYDFVNGDNVPFDDYGHGTHVTGIAAALGNNGVGIAGVSWGARILPVKVLDSSGNGTFSNVAAGIIWATDQGAQVINMSLGGSGVSQILQDAVNYADGQGVLMIASSGNTNSNSVLFPAGFSQVMAVAATDASNQRASFSNYGTGIEIAAPGVNIISLWPGGTNTLSGTSMAAPHVSGLAAILFGYESNPASIRNYLKASALDIPPAGFDIYTGAGLIQMDAALALLAYNSKPNPGGEPAIPPVFISTPLWTLTPLATLTPASVTLTFTPQITVSVPPQPTDTPQKPNESTSTPELEAQGQKPAPDFGSPYFCVGILLILLGILLLLYHRNSRSRRRHSLEWYKLGV